MGKNQRKGSISIFFDRYATGTDSILIISFLGTIGPASSVENTLNQALLSTKLHFRDLALRVCLPPMYGFLALQKSKSFRLDSANCSFF